MADLPVADIRPALRAFLLADAAVSTAVGGSRIFPGALPQGETRPSIVYNLISDQGDYHNEGPSNLGRPRYQLDAWANSLDVAASLAIAIKNRIDGYRGLMGSGAAQVNVRGVFRDAGGREGYDAAAQLWLSGRDYFIWFDEQ